ncbi:MAG: TrmH family RNA methyltransferase [Saprospiraceae bacterium]|nr:TrmH family RNA methyltransferase [Saprospiraceae bacterium]
MDIKKLSLLELHRDLPEEYKKKPKISVFFVTDHIRSGHNIGSLFRIADAFAISKIYICGYKVDVQHAEIKKSAIGSENTVEWEYFEDITLCLQELRSKGVVIMGLEQTTHSIPIQKMEIDSERPIALVFGNEVEGISDNAMKFIDDFIEIPQWGTKHSLNVSVAAGILSWEIVKRLKF